MKTSRRSFMGGAAATVAALALGTRRAVARARERLKAHQKDGDLDLGRVFPPDPEDGQVWELTESYLGYPENVVWKFDGALQAWKPISHNQVLPAPLLKPTMRDVKVTRRDIEKGVRRR